LYHRLSIVTSLCLAINLNLAAKAANEPHDLDQFLYKEHDSTAHDSAEKKSSFLDSLRSFNDWPREKKVIALNLTAVGAMAAMGAVSWDYCSSSFHFHNEGWFNPDTPFGGADKLGHAFSAYAMADIYHSIYRSWGYWVGY
jgi:Predicted periplasmic lipoprotein (DUF2279)